MASRDFATTDSGVRAISDNSRVDLLDQIDKRRFDSLAILDAANAFGGLSDAELDGHMGLWDYAGMDEASHPLSALLRESHNDTCAVRDLDGTLQLIWQESSISDRWSRGPLCRENLLAKGEVEEHLEDNPKWLIEAGISMPVDDLLRVLADLPNSDRPVVSF